MNNEKNKKIWLKKCEENLRMGGRSEVTIRNYIYSIKHFLNFYSNRLVRKLKMSYNVNG